MSPSEGALAEIESTRLECLNLLSRIRDFQAPTEHNVFDPTFRLIVTPMLYSIWERFFSLCHEVCLRLIRDTAVNPLNLASETRAVWLMHSGFYKSMIDKLRNQAFLTADEKIKKGHYMVLCKFLAELDDWSRQAMDQSLSTEELVMTMSNVNPDVVKVNAKAIGLDESNFFKEIKLGKLHDLVGRRNDIGHGAVIEPAVWLQTPYSSN